MKKAFTSRRLGEAGFSLMEVLVFVTILSLFFISAITITTFSLRNLKIQEHKILATRFSEEGLEWVKQEKEDNWQSFLLHDDSGGSGTTYCLNTLNWSTRSDCNISYDLGPPNMFKRVLTLVNSGNPVDRIYANLAVKWMENNVEQEVVLKSVFSLWE